MAIIMPPTSPVRSEEPLDQGVTMEETEGEENWRPFPHIPLDIARLIFEKAMESTPMPVHLALVSRQVQHWVEPLIYRNLTFRTASTFILFYRTFRNRRYSPSKSTEFFAKHVKSLHILSKVAPRMERMIAIGRVMKGLRAAAGWDNSWGCYMLGFLAYDCIDSRSAPGLDNPGWHPNAREEREMRREEAERRRRAGLDELSLRGWVEGEDSGEEMEKDSQDLRVQSDLEALKGSTEDSFAYKDLRRLSLSAHSLRIFRINFTNRLFRDITHLDIYYCRLYDWSTITRMKNLTHLAADFLTLVNLDFIEMKQCMDEMIGYCQELPLLKVMIFACINWWSKDFDLLDDEDNVLSPLNFSSGDWRTGGPLISTTIDECHLHYFTQLSLGMHDPRVVLGVVSDCLPKSHLMKECMVNFVWPRNSYDWDFTVPTEKHKESWDVAEEIIEKRLAGRKERRRKMGAPALTTYRRFDDEDEYMNGEFGFGEIVEWRWKEGVAESED